MHAMPLEAGSSHDVVIGLHIGIEFDVPIEVRDGHLFAREGSIGLWLVQQFLPSRSHAWPARETTEAVTLAVLRRCVVCLLCALLCRLVSFKFTRRFRTHGLLDFIQEDRCRVLEHPARFHTPEGTVLPTYSLYGIGNKTTVFPTRNKLMEC
jgi:hypothetical protein